MAHLDHVLAESMHNDFQFPESFCLEKGIYGGLVLAVAVQRIESCTDHPIRSLQLNFSSLAFPNTATRCDVQLMRRGSKTETFSVSLYQGEICIAHGAAFTGALRATMDDACFVQKPSAPPPESVTSVSGGMALPPFTAHFQMRPCLGGMICSGAEPRTGGYISMADSSLKLLKTAHIAALIDAWWPSFFITAQSMRPMGTTAIQINFNAELTPIVSSPLLLEIDGQVLVGGFGTETNRLWSPSGRLLAVAQQSIAIIA